MFKAKNIYKKHGLEIWPYDDEKKNHQNELDGWKHDGWALACG